MKPSPRAPLSLLFLFLALVWVDPAWSEQDLLPSISVDGANLTVKLEVVAGGGGLSIPSDLAAAPDGTGRLFVSMIGGDVRVIDGAGTLLPTPFMSTASGDSFTSGDTQFTSIAFHPEFGDSGAAGYRKLYTIEPEKSTVGTPDFLPDFGGNNHRDVVYEYTVDVTTDNVFAGTKRELMRAQNPGTSHNFDDLAFDAAGLLYISTGDGQNNDFVSQNANVLTNPYGKVLRIDPLGLVGALSANGQYSIPGTNYTVGMGGGVVEEIFATGLRNPYRLTFDSLTGDAWLGDVGQDNIEEVDRIPAASGGGQDFAWTRREGSFQNTTSQGGPTQPGDVLPVFEYDHQDGGNIVGGYVYRGAAIPALDGLYVFGDYQGNRDNDPQVPPVANEGRLFYGDPATGNIFEFNVDPTGSDVPFRVLSIGQGSDGELYVLGNDASFQGVILRIAQADSSSGDPDFALHTRFDAAQISGTTVLDTAGTPQNGTILGAGVTNPAGQLAEALDFPGADTDHVDFGDVLDPGTGSYSVSFWFNTPDILSTQYLVGKGNAGSSVSGWSVFFENGTLVARGQHDGGLAGDRFGQSIDAAIAADTWHHVALVLDTATDTVRGYLDGSNTGWVAGGGGAVVDTLLDGVAITSVESLLVGRRSTAGAFLDGAVDDLAIWTRALSAAEVQRLYDDGLIGLDAANLPPPAPAPSLALHTTLDTADISGTTVQDTAGTPQDGTINGVGVANPVGQIGEALSFPGADTDHVDFGDVFDPGSGSFTVSLWFNADEVATTQYLIGKGNESSGSVGWSLFIESGTLIARGYQSGAVLAERFSQTSPAVSAATWHHVAMVIDTASDTVRGYLDGSNAGWLAAGGGGQVDTLVDGLPIENAAALLLARRLTGGAPFAGSLDDLAIWTRALAPSEIQALYDNGLLGQDASTLPTPGGETLELLVSGNGSVSASPDQVEYALGQTVQLTASPDPGWVFTGFSGSLESLDNPADIVIAGSDSVTASFAQAELGLLESFDGFAPGADPPEWFDTAPGNSLVEDDLQFSVYDVDGETVFGTTSTDTNIHSHYVGPGAGNLSSYDFTGRMQLSADGGIGVTFHSQFPALASYYRLRRLPGDSFKLVNLGPFTDGGITDTGVVPVPGIWYRFHVRMDDTGTQTEIRANVWVDGDPEPAGWQIDAFDQDTDRLTAGTFGLWSFSSGAKYWDDLSVVGSYSPSAEDMLLHASLDASDVTGAVVRDRAGAPEDGTLAGVAAVGGPGQIAEALDFPGGDTDHVDFGDVHDPGTGSYSVSLWFNTDDITTTQFLAGKGNAGSSDPGWSIFLEQGTLGVRGLQDGQPLGARFSQTIPATISTATWHHVVMVIDTANDVVRGYLDGSNAGWVAGGFGGQVDTLADGESISSSESLLLARRSSPGAPFDGLLDDLAIFDRALSPAEVTQLHADGLVGIDASNLVPDPAPPPAQELKLHTTLDTADISGTTVLDSAGTPQNGTLLGAGSGNPSGQMGEALSLPGADADHVDFGDVLDPGDGSYTVSLWFNASDVVATQFLAGKGNASSGDVGWSLFVEDGSLIVRGRQTNSLVAQRFGQHIPATIASGTWHYVALVIDRSAGTVRGYLDGSNAGWLTGGGGAPVDTLVPGLSIGNSEAILLGRRATPGAAFAGAIDDFAIFNRALTTTQIGTLHANGLLGVDASALGSLEECGDSLVEGAEECDDGNAVGGDCCSASCLFETDGSICSDGNACTDGDSCNSVGVCISGGPLACDDAEPCTDDACDVGTGCVFTPNADPCDDADACTTGDVCAAGSCTGGPPLVCDDGLTCTTDSCDSGLGCQFDPEPMCQEPQAVPASGPGGDLLLAALLLLLGTMVLRAGRMHLRP